MEQNVAYRLRNKIHFSHYVCLLPCYHANKGRQVSCFHSTAPFQVLEDGPGRMAYVHDQVRPTTQKSSDELFRHAKHPKTVSIIG